MSEMDAKALISLLEGKKEDGKNEQLKQLISSVVSEKKSVATPKKLNELYKNIVK